jgi:DNA-binding MarR family transcriptional regulator
MTTALNPEELRRTALLTLHSTCGLMTRCGDAVFKSRASVSYQQFIVLLTIASTPPPVNQTDVAKQTQRELNSISMIIDRMEASGLVTRTRSELDRRTVYLSLTRAGKATLERGTVVSEALTSRLTSGFTTQEAESAVQLLTKLRKNILKELGEEEPVIRSGSKTGQGARHSTVGDNRRGTLGGRKSTTRRTRSK